MSRRILALAFLLAAPLLLPAQSSAEADVQLQFSRHAENAWISVRARVKADERGRIEWSWPARLPMRSNRRAFRGDQIRDLRAFGGPKARRLRVESGGRTWFTRARPGETVTFEWNAPPHLAFARRAPAARLDQPYYLELADVVLRLRGEHVIVADHHNPEARARQPRRVNVPYSYHLSFAPGFGPEGAKLAPRHARSWEELTELGMAMGARELEVPDCPLRLRLLLPPPGPETEPFDPTPLTRGLAALWRAQTSLRGQEPRARELLVVINNRRGRRPGGRRSLVFEQARVLRTNPRGLLDQAASGLAFDADRDELMQSLGFLGLTPESASAISPSSSRARTAVRDGLWLVEGVPSYLGLLARRRARLGSRQDLLDRLQGLVDRALTRPRAFSTSAFELGRVVSDPRGTADAPSVFEQGALLAFCLDTLLRDEQGGGGLHAHRVHWPAFAIGEAPQTLSDPLRRRLERFFARHVRGNAFPPIEEAFARYGLKFRRNLLRSDFPFAWTRRDQGIVVTDPRGFAGVRAGDFVLAVNDREAYDLRALLRGEAKNRRPELRFARGKRSFNLRVPLRNRRHWLTDLEVAETKGAAADRREAWWRDA